MSRFLLVTDLDNTLYDWVTFYSQAVSAMARATAELLDTSEKQVLSELKLVHQRYGNSEVPFAILELPSVQARFPSASRLELMKLLDPVLHAFNSVRKHQLALYPGVAETLRQLHSDGVIIVGHTEAIVVNAYYRLVKLGIDGFFSRLYAAQGGHLGHPDENRTKRLAWPPDFVVDLPPSERKPDPAVLLDICAREKALPEQTVYVGDSLTRDMAMAIDAGAFAVWARYGRKFDASHWDKLVEITHWTKADVVAEEALRERSKTIRPERTIDSFVELLDVFHARVGLGQG
jgi:phosphoglycolate phosphatase